MDVLLRACVAALHQSSLQALDRERSKSYMLPHAQYGLTMVHCHLQALKQTENADKLSKKNLSTGLAASGQQAAGSWMSKIVNGVNVWVNGK